MITQFDTTAVADKNKIHRARDKLRLQSHSNQIVNPVTSVYFDGRKDKTMKIIDGKRRIVTEEHIVILIEPGSQYMGHTSPDSSSASNILHGITKAFNEKSISLNDVKVIGCDGTITNTGNRGGLISRFEHYIGSTVQWSICLLHANELPLRHLLYRLDGASKGPNALSGPIGKAIETCSSLPRARFNLIQIILPANINRDLSTDQAYLFDICQVVSSGNCSDSLLHKERTRKNSSFTLADNRK